MLLPFEMPRQRCLATAAILASIWSCVAIGQTSFDVNSFDVKRFGARGAGVTDDAGAIQKAIDAAAEAGGGVVLFPGSARAYLVTRTLKITSSDIELSGDGATIRLANGAANDTGKKPLLNTAGQVHVIYVTGTESERIRNVRITGLTVDGNIYNQSGYYNPRGIVFEHAEHVLVKDVRIVRTFVGLDFAPVLFYGPLKGLRIDGGSYNTMYLGWEYGSKRSREPGGPFGLADARIGISTTEPPVGPSRPRKRAAPRSGPGRVTAI